jgi:hypothetical protein
MRLQGSIINLNFVADQKKKAGGGVPSALKVSDDRQLISLELFQMISKTMNLTLTATSVSQA